MQKIIISILHYNKTEDTINCLKSLLNLNLSNTEIETVVLDNGSKKELKINVAEFDKIGLNVVRSNQNTGFAKGHNLVYEKIQDKQFDYFLILNNDCMMERESINRLIDAFKSDKVGVAVPKIYFTKGYEFHGARYKENEKGKVFWYAGGKMDWENVMSRHVGIDEVDRRQYEKIEKIDFATGACQLIKKEVIRKVGLFDEKYFLYYEDADLSQRILKAGFNILYQPKSIVWHNNAGASGSGSELHDYYLTRNRMLFGIKYAPLKIKALLIKESMRIFTTGRKWQRIGIKDYYLHKFNKGSFTP